MFVRTLGKIGFDYFHYDATVKTKYAQNQSSQYFSRCCYLVVLLRNASYQCNVNIYLVNISFVSQLFFFSSDTS